jgi:hypothetical protein
LSIKDRGAILPPDILLIGHFGIAQQVHLFQVRFMVNLPNWVTEFNQEKRYMNYINKGWNLIATSHP